MSVIVLFAIGIKLISAIVNPDVLDGGDSKKKKSAKQSFIDAIIAVFLIILIPMAFNILTTFQSELIESKFIQKYIFGISFTAESQTEVGQILAYQTLSSFLYPCPETGDDKCTNREEGINQMNAISWDIRNMYQYIDANDLKFDVRTTNDGAIHKNSLIYHPILCLIAGALVLYQVILMALDMALRAAKIGLLELMTPIILGAFIFNKEILTKWVKEFIATYLSAFLKLLAVTMMVLGLSRVNTLFANFEESMNSVDSTVAKGLLRLILVMGILRLAKEVPNLINKIFGTNIQPQGGIKGRLGQMAGVGGLAQKAWSALGTGAKNVAKLIPQGVAAAGYKLGDNFYNKRTGRHLNDTGLFKNVKGIGSGVGTALKTGSLMKAKAAYDSGSAAPKYTVGERLSARNEVLGRLRGNATDVNGRNLIDRAGNFVNSFVDANGKQHYVPIDEIEKTQGGILTALSSRGRAGQLRAQEERAKMFKSQLEGLDAKNKSAIESLSQYQALHSSDPGMTGDVKTAGQIMTKIEKGQKLTAADNQWLTAQAARGESTVVKAQEQINKMYSQAVDMASKFGEYDGSTAQLSIGQLIGTTDGVISDAHTQFEQAATNLSDIDKDAIELMASSYESTFKAYSGAEQNNGQILTALESFGNGGDVSFNGTDYVDSTGTPLKAGEQNLFELITSGRVKTSVADYYGTNLEDQYVEEFDSFVSDAKAKADRYIGLTTYSPGDPGYEAEYARIYYNALHDDISHKYGPGQPGSTDPRANDIMTRMNRITGSNILPH